MYSDSSCQYNALLYLLLEPGSPLSIVDSTFPCSCYFPETILKCRRCSTNWYIASQTHIRKEKWNKLKEIFFQNSVACPKITQQGILVYIFMFHYTLKSVGVFSNNLTNANKCSFCRGRGLMSFNILHFPKTIMTP